VKPRDGHLDQSQDPASLGGGHCVDDLRAADLLDRDVVLGAMAAQGVSPNGLRRLGQLIDASSGR
jgi:hypothetical protein